MCHLPHFLCGTKNAETDEENGVLANHYFNGNNVYDLILVVCGKILHNTLYHHLRSYRSVCILSENDAQKGGNKMIYLKLFLTFFEIGMFTFGGGYAMISLIRDKALAFGWLSEEELLNMVAVSESTPGPIAVNMATFVGSTQGGIIGSLLATLGVVMPSFIIILLISAFIRNFLKYKGVQAFLKGVRPCIVALILTTAITMALSTLLSFTTLTGGISPDIRGIIILTLLVILALVWKKIKNKKPSPILMILISAGLGMLFYSI